MRDDDEPPVILPDAHGQPKLPETDFLYGLFRSGSP
jgi:hypothetical protein